MTTDQITPRDIRFNVSRNATRNWICGDLVQTAVWDGLSALLPEGERFFIRSVLYYRDSITDPELRERVNQFIAQEGNHSREHADYNKGMRSLGYDIDAMEAGVRTKLASIKSPLVRLAVTCSVEHYTAILSIQILTNSYYLEHAPVAYREIWQWHALEELEHKAVPFDVFTFVTRDMSALKRYALRTGAMVESTKYLSIQLYNNVHEIFHSDGRDITLKTWIRWLWIIIVKPGVFRRTLPYYFRYYLPGFHPEKFTDKDLMQKWREHYQPAAVTGNR